MSGGGSGGGSGGSGGGGSGIGHAIGNVVKGVTSAAKSVVKTWASIPSTVLSGGKTAYSSNENYYDSSGDSLDNLTTDVMTQEQQSSGADQYSEGESDTSFSGGSILTGNNPGQLMLGKKALLGKKK